MSFLCRFPTEILLLIADQVGHIFELGALSLTCRQLHGIIDPALYRVAARRHPYLLSWACETGRLSMVEKLLNAGCDLNRPFRIPVSRKWRLRDAAESGKPLETSDDFYVLDEIYSHALWTEAYALIAEKPAAVTALLARQDERRQGFLFEGSSDLIRAPDDSVSDQIDIDDASILGDSGEDSLWDSDPYSDSDANSLEDSDSDESETQTGCCSQPCNHVDCNDLRDLLELEALGHVYDAGDLKDRLFFPDDFLDEEEGWNPETYFETFEEPEDLFAPEPPSSPDDSLNPGDHACRYWFPLHAAAMAGRNDIVQLLAGRGARLDVPSFGLCHCQHYFMDIGPEFNNEEFWEEDDLAIEKDREIEGWMALHIALCHNNDSTARLLLSIGATPVVNPRYPQLRAVHQAAAHDAISTLDFLVEGAKADLNMPDHRSLTPLLHAFGEPNSVVVIRWLLSHGADPNMDIGDGCTALHVACYYGFYEEAMELICSGAGIKAQWVGACPGSGRGASLPVHLSCIDGFASYNPRTMVNKLRRAGYYENVARENKREQLGFDVVKKLLDLWPQDDSRRALVNSCLQLAATARRPWLLEFFVDNGGDIHHEDERGSFPLMAAMETYSSTRRNPPLSETVAWLLERGVSPNQRNGKGKGVADAMHEYCHLEEELDVSELLAQYGGDACPRDRFGKSTLSFFELDLAIKEPIRLNFMRAILDDGVSPNDVLHPHSRPALIQILLRATTHKPKHRYNLTSPGTIVDAVKLLVTHGADLSCQPLYELMRDCMKPFASDLSRVLNERCSFIGPEMASDGFVFKIDGQEFRWPPGSTCCHSEQQHRNFFSI